MTYKDECLITHQTAAIHFVLNHEDFKIKYIRNLVVQGVPFRESFWFRATFKDGKKENTLSIVVQGDLMISSESIELSKLCPSNK